MKIVSWNCNGALRNKFHELYILDADIIIIQECENPSLYKNKYENFPYNYLWTGKNKNKGIGIFTRKDILLESLPWAKNELEEFLPCRVNNKFNLLAVWTKQANSPTFKYIGQLWKYIQLNREHLKISPLIIGGDFNSNSCWDLWDRWWNHSDVVSELNSLGIRSAYHFHFNESQGKEAIPTFYMNRKIERPYHIDYFFASKDILENSILQLGDRDIWLKHSDHVPLVFEFK